MESTTTSTAVRSVDNFHIHIFREADAAQPPTYFILSKWKVIKANYQEYLLAEYDSLQACCEWIEIKRQARRTMAILLLNQELGMPTPRNKGGENIETF